MRNRIAVRVFALLVVVQLALIAVIDAKARDVTRAWRPFAIPGLRDGVSVVQTFDIGYHGLERIDLDAEMSPAAATRHVDVRIAGPEGSTTVTREADIAIPPGQTECCHIAFQKIPSSGRRFQLQLAFRGFTAAQPLTLQATTVRLPGGLSVNGRTLTANLVMRPDGDIEHLPGAMRVSLVGFGSALVAIDLLVAFAASAYCRRRP